jgi:hypothetical protein
MNSFETLLHLHVVSQEQDPSGLVVVQAIVLPRLPSFVGLASHLYKKQKRTGMVISHRLGLLRPYHIALRLLSRSYASSCCSIGL